MAVIWTCQALCKPSIAFKVIPCIWDLIIRALGFFRARDTSSRETSPSVSSLSGYKTTIGETAIRKSRFSEEQIAAALKEREPNGRRDAFWPFRKKRIVAALRFFSVTRAAPLFAQPRCRSSSAASDCRPASAKSQLVKTWPSVAN